MSEFTGKQPERKKNLLAFCMRILRAEKPSEAVELYTDIMESISASEVIWVVDEMVKQNIPMPELKTGINKILNLFYNTLNNNPIETPAKYSFLGYLSQNNHELDIRLKAIKPLLRKLNQDENDLEVISALKDKFTELLLFDNHYVIEENILFPVLEKHWKDFRCVQVMWSFHDDIRRNIKSIIELLESNEFDLSEFNSLIGNIFFDMYAIKFREEKILFPHILQTITTDVLDKMLQESLSFKWPFIEPDKSKINIAMSSVRNETDEIDLKTGFLLPEQIRWMLNHLPVDITYVDENNKVKYFSSPKKRIFPRTNAIIGRDVKNCHPQESVHIVEQIIEAFREGKKDKANFWIKMKDEFILIQYFAIRDKSGNYKGVIEVSQEVSEIKALEGENRLLDWE
ncbi:MAG: PAS domain-containing protein [Bacteroidales bacterium]|nr:PAS domain-containing protein [Bacteroidales bacterium]